MSQPLPRITAVFDIIGLSAAIKPQCPGEPLCQSLKGLCRDAPMVYVKARVNWRILAREIQPVEKAGSYVGYVEVERRWSLLPGEEKANLLDNPEVS